MHHFHHDRRRYFDIQVENARESIIPFIESFFPLPPGARILEIGCGEGGILRGFAEKGHTAIGIELEAGRVLDGMSWMKEEIASGSVRIIADDVFNVTSRQLGGHFHLVILKDVIEHLRDKELLLSWIKNILHPDGIIFFGFPPWQMPFGGHQQLCRNKYLSRLPWLHMLPRKLYEFVLRRFKNEPVDELLEIYDSRISIEGFEQLAKKSGYAIHGTKHFLIAPIYKYKFGLATREQWTPIRKIPYLRNVFTTAVYYVITPDPISRNSDSENKPVQISIEVQPHKNVPGLSEALY
jgi:SAM-dependent methyltransferase